MPSAGRVKQRIAANSADQVTLTANERILKDCHEIYADPNNGLVKIAHSLGLKLLAPRKKITILLIGNHSAGKSSFINWYIEEHVQKTGVAIETQGFSFVTSGRRRESLTGNATLHLYPHFRPLQELQGVVDFLTAEISTSKQKKFSLVTFIDTPGLVDGDMVYPYDVNETIVWLGGIADLIFIFFDPIGQALCKRTMNLVEELNQEHTEKMRFYLSKADEAGHESDRQRVMMQIVQELCKRPGLNRASFDMPTIYIPNPNKHVRCHNQIDVVCQEIEHSINHTIQKTLNQLEKDCDYIAQLVDDRINCDDMARSHNMKASGKGFLLVSLGSIVPIMLLIHLFLSDAAVKSLAGDSAGHAVNTFMVPVRIFWEVLPSDYHVMGLVTILAVSAVLLLLARWVCRGEDTLSRRQKRILREHQDYVQNYVKEKKRTFYREYLEQCVSEYDI